VVRVQYVGHIATGHMVVSVIAFFVCSKVGTCFLVCTKSYYVQLASIIFCIDPFDFYFADLCSFSKIFFLHNAIFKIHHIFLDGIVSEVCNLLSYFKVCYKVIKFLMRHSVTILWGSCKAFKFSIKGSHFLLLITF